MKVTLNWLKDFIDLKDSAENIADKLTLAGMEVEEIIKQDKYIDHVRIGRIKEITQHPNADKLVVCQVDIGDKIVQIITSAKNVKVGDLVPVSLPGAHLANGIEIKASQMRGVNSDGMFCSGEELGIGDDIYEGASQNLVLVFREDIKEGTFVADFLGLNDTIFDINVTANRPDCNSVIGIAKELSAIYKIPFKSENLDYKSTSDNVNNYVSVDVLNPEFCPRYIASAVKDVKIQKSPKWLANRLNAVGIKSINNIVDITNYVLIEYGQPMHAFDQSHIGGHKIIVRTAFSGEKIDCLDNNSYELSNSDLVICDDKKPMVIAGVIGGLNSCVENNSQTIIFESACFERKTIRVTSRKFGIRTDSSARFERGVDIASPVLGMKKALKLINELNCGTVCQGVVDRCFGNIEPRIVKSSVDKINNILGIKIPNDEILAILNNLQIKSKIEGDTLICEVTPERFDIECANDIAEELIRFYGYDVYNNVDKKVLSETNFTVGKNNDILQYQNVLENILVENGYYQAVNYSMVPKNHANLLGIDDKDMVVISNPLSEDLACMRLSLAHWLLVNVSNNIKRGNSNFKLFEFGRTYKKADEDYQVLPNETNMCGIVINDNSEDFYSLKGIIESLISSKQLAYKMERSKSPILHPGKSADIYDLQSKTVIASFGEIHPKVASSYNVPQNTLYGEINLDIMQSKQNKKIVVKPISKFQVVERDLAVIVDENVAVGDILSSLQKSCQDTFLSAEIFDIYRSKQLGENLKSVAIKFKLSSLDRTLTDEEINNTVSNILNDLDKKFKARLRQ